MYCEKPLAGSVADARAMIEARDRTGRRLQMQVLTVFSKATKAARRLIDEGRLGKLYYAKSSSYRRRGRPYVDGYGTMNFVQKKIAGGGALYDVGIYQIVQVLYLLGNPGIRTISGATHQEIEMYADRRESSGFDVEELAVGFVRLEGGITFAIEEAWAIHGSGTEGSKIFGSAGGVSLSPFAYHTTVGDMEMSGTFNLDGADVRWHRCIENWDGYDDTQRHWVAVQQGRVEQVDTALLGLQMMRIAEGIYLSSAEGREVSVEEVDEKSVSTAVTGL